MSTMPVAAISQRIILVCFGLEASHLHKQPWHSVWGIAEGLQLHGFDVCIITDAKHPPLTSHIHIESIDVLFEGDEQSPSLRAALIKLAPQRVIVVIGTQELLWPQRFISDVPVSLLLANQRFRANELMRLTWREWWYEWPLLRMLLVQAITPSFFLRRGLLRAHISHLIYLSTAAQKRHADAGLPPGSVIKPRVRPEFLKQTNSTVSTKSKGETKTLCYFGPPLFLRGIKHVIAAFVAARERGCDVRLSLFLRVDDEYTTQRAAELKTLIEQHTAVHKEHIHCIDEVLSAAQLAKQFDDADIFVLPFSVTVSDVPLVIIEAAMSGKPVITFDTPGVSEWSEIFPNIVLTTACHLSEAMQRAVVNSAPLHFANSTQWSDWKLALDSMARALRDPLDCSSLHPYRMVCLMGVDGSGKSTLLARLSEQFGLQGYAHGYLWSRFRNYLSKPYLALLRLTGHNRKIVVDGARMGVHDFVGHPLISRVFLFLQLCDMWLDIHLRYLPRLRKGRILGDRCPLDTLVDLAIDTGMDEAIFGAYGKRVLSWLPQPSLIVVVTRNAKNAQRDRPDIAFDPNYSRRVGLYTRLAQTFALPVLNNDGTFDESLRQLNDFAESQQYARSVARV